ncbi:MAG: aldehyde dehydrogenase family protein [Microthrixaceae bacterium]
MTSTMETRDPRDGSLIAVVPDMSRPDVVAAVARARAAHPRWAEAGFAQRRQHLLGVRDRLLDRAEELVATICSETGKQPAEAVTTELMAVCDAMEWYARHGAAALRPVRVSPGTLAHKQAWKEYSPVGVVGVISPWNYPFTLSMTPLVTALFAGNTVVLKPSEVTPTVGLVIGELFESDDFGGIVQVVTGGGATGEALVRSGVDKVVFTGSVDTGRKVMRAASDTLTPVLLELGGKDPMIVARDADLDRAAKGAVWGAFQNSGQTCMSVERVYVDGSVHDEFLGRVLEQTSRIRQDDTGSGDIGSMTFAPQLDKVEAHIEDALGRGAKLELGGHRLDRPGLWFEPTVLSGVDHTMAVMTEETFGPVLPVMSVGDIDEAIKLANDSRYGLNSSVWTTDRIMGERVASRLETGNVCINDCLVSYAVTGLPFGGVKDSGIGRVHGAEGLREFCDVKSVLGQKRLPSMREPWWFPLPANMDRLTIATLRLRYGRSARTRLRGLTARR